MQLITRLMSLIWSHDIFQAGLHIHNRIRRAWKCLYAHLNLIMMIFCTSCCYSTHWWSVLFSNRKNAKIVCGSQISLMFEGPYAFTQRDACSEEAVTAMWSALTTNDTKTFSLTATVQIVFPMKLSAVCPGTWPSGQTWEATGK